MRDAALQERRNRQILADIVRTYIETGEPVSSRVISQRFEETLSTATIRNVMADLEDGGLLYQPHTSAGRVPTAAAYRFFAQEIASRAKLSIEDRDWIKREFNAASSSADMTERAGHVLAEVSSGLGIIVSPPLARTVLEHARMWLLPDGRVVVVLISHGGVTRATKFCDRPGHSHSRSWTHRRIFEPALYRLDAGSDSRGFAAETGDRTRTLRRNRTERVDVVRSHNAG
jgi:Transcriptional regulator of heat shock gene